MSDPFGETPFDEWDKGKISDRVFLNHVVSTLGEIQSELDPLLAEEQQYKSWLGFVVAKLQGTMSEREYHEIKDLLAKRGYRVSFSSPSTRRTVSVKDLIQLKDRMAPDVWELVEACIRETPVDGTQRIERIKEKSS